MNLIKKRRVLLYKKNQKDCSQMLPRF